MKKYQVITFSLIFTFYGWLYYQKHYSGPDFYDYIREKSSGEDSFSILFLNPEEIIGQSRVFYGEFQDNYITSNGYINSHSEIIFFNKDQSNFKIDCPSEEIKIKGVIQKHKGYYYFESIESIMGYDMIKTNQSFWMLTPCN